VDEPGFVPFERTGGSFNLLAQRFERCPSIITTNLAFGDWWEDLGSDRVEQSHPRYHEWLDMLAMGCEYDHDRCGRNASNWACRRRSTR